jgi:carboxylesterase type B
MYPPDFSGAQGYTDQIGRTAKLTGEFFFKCFIHNFANAFSNRTYSYNFNVGTAIHGDDIAYTFFNGEEGPVPEIAVALQEYITHFVQFGTPTEARSDFEMYGSNEMVLVLGNANITMEKDPNSNERCEYLKKGLQF